MAVTKTLEKVQVKMNLTNGTDPSTGEVRTVSVSLGALNPAASKYDAQKALNCCKAIKNCLTKALYSVSEITTNTLSESA